MSALRSAVLELDCAAEVERIVQSIRLTIRRQLHRRGAVVAVSGGVDSAVCAALAVRAVGSERTFGLLLPESESSAESASRGLEVVEALRIPFAIEDVGPALEAVGCYRRRDAAIRRLVPGYGAGWKSNISIARPQSGGLSFFHLVVQDPEGTTSSLRLPAVEYLEIVAATNFKQRIRKAVECFHADRLGYVVLGTPNRLEYDQGFFVKYGDGAADLKPIAHLYKTQVYALARFLGLPAAVCDAQPTADTYTLGQRQDEFYFGLPYAQMDLAIWARNHDCAPEELAAVIGVSAAAARAIYADIDAKRRTTAYLHAPPILVEPIAGIGGSRD